MLYAAEDRAAARQWWQRAADSGQAEAMAALGELLEDEDPDAARQWFQRAASAGNANATDYPGHHEQQRGNS
jgi:TPR repeat protein